MNEIAIWLAELGLDKYAAAFAENEVDFEILPELTEPDLEKLGLPLGPRKKLLKAIASLGAGDNTVAEAATGRAAAQQSAVGPYTPQTYTPQHLAERILNSRSAIEGERKQVTVLFADIKGSTELVERLDPEQANRLLDPILGAMMEAVHRFEGTVNKVQGDGLMALFGAPLAHEDHAARACYAALAMQRSVAALSADKREPIQIRVGLHSGEVVVRSIGNDLSINYDAIGMTVHLAARMEQTAPAGGIYLSAETLHLAEGLIQVSERGPTTVKGVSEPVAVYQLEGATAARTRWQATLRRGLSRFVGREEALERLARSLSRADQGRGQIVAIVGEAGVGKSRLVYEFIRSPPAQAWQVLAGSSVSYGKASDWLPVIDFCKAYFEIDESDDANHMTDKVRTRLENLDPAFSTYLPPFLALLQLSVTDASWQALGALQQRRRTLDAIQALLVHESQHQPLLLIFEDLHWIDGETQALLDELVEQLPSHRILLLTDYRPEYNHSWANKSYYQQLRLDPLEQTGAAELLSDLLGDDVSLDDFKVSLIEHTAGNPLFLEESVRSLVETGTLEGEAGAYRLIGNVSEFTLPMTLQALIAQRIDRLAPADKHLLQMAAVIGTNLPLQLLQTIANMPDAELQRGLAALRAAEFIYPGQLFPEPEYRFKHAHTHQVTYTGLLQEKRRALHAQTAQALQRLYPERRSELAEKLAEHFEQGEIWEQAINYYLLAAQKGKDKYTYPSAVAYAQKVVELAHRITGQEQQQIEALVLLGDLTSLMGELDPANEFYERAEELTVDADQRQQIGNRMHRRRFAVRDGARIAFYEHGSSDQTLLFVVPTVYRVALFQPIIEKLCQEFRAVIFDPRGTGASDPVPDYYSQAEYVEDIRAVIEALDCGSVVGIGISASGRQLGRLAWKYPSLLSQLVLVSTPPTMAFFQQTSEQLRWDEQIRQGDFSAVKAWCTDFAYTLFPEPEARDLAERYIKTTLQMSPEALLNFLAGDEDSDTELTPPLLAKIKVPTLIMRGTADRQITSAASTYLLEHLPNAKLHAFIGKGHQPMYTATQEFCGVLQQFVLTGTV